MASCAKRLIAEISKKKSNYARLCCLITDFAEKVFLSSTSKDVEDDLATFRQCRSKLAQMHDCPKYKEPISDLKYQPVETKYFNSIPNSRDQLVLSEQLIETSLSRVSQIAAKTHGKIGHTKRERTKDFSKGKHQRS